MPSPWTVDQILALAPDDKSAKAAQEQAVLHRWSSLGCSQQAVWGLCQGSGSRPYQVQIDLSGPAFRCSCPSRKFPCKHVLGLLLLFTSQPDAFEAGDPPKWVAGWLASRHKRVEKQTRSRKKPRKPADPAAQARRAARRASSVSSGIEDLEVWLKDLVRQGLAAIQSKPSRFWETPAARLVDAKAPGLAGLVRNMAALPASGEGWQERLLGQLAELYLLLEGFKRLDRLPTPTQEDLRSLVGWTQNQQELLQQPGLNDLWLVVGQRVEEENLGASRRSPTLRIQRTWLLGKDCQRIALILDFIPPGQPLGTSLVPGSQFKAELVFFPSASPLRALIKARLSAPQPLVELPGYPDLQTATAAYAAALARHPWLGSFPMALRSVIPLPSGDRWLLRDEEDRCLPLAYRFSLGWQLFALSGGHALDCFGEWDGETFHPISCFAEGRWVALT